MENLTLETEVATIVPEIQNEAVSFKLPIIAKLADAAETYMIRARALTVSNNDEYLLASEVHKKGNEAAKIFWGLLNPPCQELDALHGKAVDRRDAVCGPYKEGAKLAKQKLIAWDQEQIRLQKLAQAKIDREMKEKADREALELAEELEKAGAHEAAEEVISAPVEVQQVIVPKETPRVEGFKYRSNWAFDVIDPKLVPREYLCLDMVKIGQVVRALKGEAKIPGIKVREERV